MREYGTGSKKEIAPGKWRLRVYVGDDPVTGRPKQAERIFRGTSRQATDALADLIKEKKDSPRTGSNVKYSVLLDDWLKEVERSDRARGTKETYRSHVRKHIRPALGNVPLPQLTVHRLDQFFGSLVDEGMSPSTVRIVRAIVRVSCSQGVRWGWLPANPVTNTTVSRKKVVDKTALTDDQVQAIIEAADKNGDPAMAALIILAAWIGARRGELCGLKWSDIDWNAETLTIERQIVPGEGGQYVTTTKTGKSRTIPIPQAMPALRLWRSIVLEQYPEIDPDGWLFSRDGGRTPMRAKAVTLTYSRLARSVDAPHKFHDLRHYAVTRAVTAGWDVTLASQYFGHTPQVMLGIYSHGNPEKARELAAALSR